MKTMKSHWDDEFYEIHDSANGKVISLMGYYYTGANDGGFDDEGEWNVIWDARNVSYSVEFLLSDFINRFVNGDESWSECAEYYERKEYIEDLTDEMAEQQMEEMIIENDYKALLLCELTMDTPCGCYLDVHEI